MHNTFLRIVHTDLLFNEFILFDLSILIIIRYSDSSTFLFTCLSLSFFLPQCQQYREQASVLENQPTGTFVLQVHAVDADEGANGKVKYGLMHRDSAMAAFKIHPDTGRADTNCCEINRSQFSMGVQSTLYIDSFI